MRKGRKSDEALEAARRIEKDGSRATEIIDHLRSLYKKSPPKTELVDVNEIVVEMLVLLRSEAARYSISVHTDLSPHLPKITADRVQLQQVLMNLMLNAIEAMKDTSGELTIKTEMEQSGPVLISVSDTGVARPTKTPSKSLMRSSPPSPWAAAWVYRSAVPLWNRMAADCGRLPTPDGGATFYLTVPTAAEVVEAPATIRNKSHIKNA